MATSNDPRVSLPPPAHSALVVRSLPNVTTEEREKILKDVEYNVFTFPAGLLTCDFLSDSGTSAMTDVQWAAVMHGDESYGRNWGYYCLLEAFRDVFERGSQHQQRAINDLLTGAGTDTSEADFYQSRLLGPAVQGGFVNGGRHQLARPNFFIVPQGRCAETLLFSTMSSMIAQEKEGPAQSPPVIISNGFFDTTGANAKAAGFELQTFTQPGLTDPFPKHLIGKENNFKGNLDLEATHDFLRNNSGRISMLLLAITNNWAAAQPVSMANIRGAASLAKEFGIPFFLDACRFAENAYFIHRYEAGYANSDILDIVQEMFSYVDGFTISIKKDGLANMGGVLCFRDEGVFAQRHQGVGMLLKESQIRCYGNDSYGGMSGRDLMAAAAGLYQVTKTSYLANRITQVQHFAQKLLAGGMGVAVLSPPGGHAVYLDMDAYFFGCARAPEDFASVGFTIQLIRDYGIRAAEAGPFAWEYDLKAADDPERAKIPNLVRFAVSRNVYSDEHINYTVAAIKELYKRRHVDIPNVVNTRGKHMCLRHFSAGLKPIMPTATTGGSWLEQAQQPLGHLFQAVGIDEIGRKELSRALSVVMGDWGHTLSVKSPSSWRSSLGNDGSPIEFSVAVDPTTGDAELRLLTEAQPTSSDKTGNGEDLWSRLSSAALKLNDAIVAEYGPSISLSRFTHIRELFLPPSLPADKKNIKLAAWHSFAYSARKGPQWKLYLDPSNAPDGYTALSATREAFHHLGLSYAWTSVELTLGPPDSVVYFSLDLTGKADNGAGAKVYIAHPATATATFRSQAAIIADEHAKLCSCYQDSIPVDGYEIQRFIAAMTGPDFDKTNLDLANRKPLLSCFGFTTAPAKTSNGKAEKALLANTTVHFPMDAYVSDDEEAHRRIEAYYAARAADSEAGDRYNKVLAAVQGGPLNMGRGIHAWVSLKQNIASRTGPGAKKRGGIENTFYFCPEILEGSRN